MCSVLGSERMAAEEGTQRPGHNASQCVPCREFGMQSRGKGTP